jgi:hypothetical protein
MDRPLPFQPIDRNRYPSGWMLSAGLHLLMLAAAFWYLMARPLLPPSIPVLPVELVTLSPVSRPAATPGPPGRSAPRPAVTPRPTGVRPDATEPAPDELDARLQALSRLNGPDGPLRLGNGDGAGNGGGLSLRDFIRAQILRRWVPDLSRDQRRDRPVLLRISVTANGVISDIVIIDREQFNGDLLFRNMAIAARNAAMLASPVRMPPGNWPGVSTFVIDLDPKAASR